VLTEYSFFNDQEQVVKNAIIDLNDTGDYFFNQYVKNDNPNILTYMINGTRWKFYDFKRYGTVGEVGIEYLYRGVNFKGKIASARDVGNYSAGFVAGRKGISWAEARLIMNLLESFQNLGFTAEGNTKRSISRSSIWDKYV